MSFVKKITGFLKSKALLYKKFRGGRRTCINLYKERYNNSDTLEPDKKGVIIMFDGSTPHHGGLADRLKGCLSAYSIYKKRGIPFMINFTSPFNLEKYLAPNRYDWRISSDEVCYNQKYAKTALGGVVGWPRSKKWGWANKYRQMHLYTFGTATSKEQWPTLFDELFKPTDRLNKELKKNIEQMGSEKYHAAAFRFLELLGDFKEAFDYKTLSQEEQKDLLQRCVNKVKEHTEAIPDDYRLLVTADSITFINAVKDIPKVYVVPGQIGHSNVADSDEDVHLKTFLDFLMLKKAEKVTLYVTGDMYNSGFSRLAATVGGGCFETVRF